MTPKNNQYLPVISPIDESFVTEQPRSEGDDVLDAVEAARNAFQDWSVSSPQLRAHVLNKFADGIDEGKVRLARLESITGKPLRESEGDIQDAAATFRYYAKLALDLEQEIELPGDDDTRVTMLREARGVVAAIIPWNYPLLIHAWKLAPALAAGCTCIVKPSEVTPSTAFELAKIAQGIPELPPGVYNCIFGTGIEAGSPLTTAKVDRITFTGSVETGRKIMRNASENLVPVSLELGGKSPMIVLEDAKDDLIQWIMMGIFFNAGQVCSATSRLFLPESIADQVIAELVAATRKIQFVEKPLHEWIQDEQVQMGPIVNKTQFEKVSAYIESAKTEKILYTGTATPLKGYFVSPTIIEPSLDSKVWKEEIFGPVLSVYRYKTIDEAIRLANDSPFGLACAVMSKNVKQAKDIAKQIQCGIRWINCSQPTLVQAPWSARKQSGFGGDLSKQALDANLVSTQLTERTSPFTWFH